MNQPLFLSDQTGYELEIDFIPQRIVSLVPSQTELLYDMGLGDRVVGITKFCIHPEEWQSTKRSIGGTKSIRLDWIDELQPDFIIANKEENTKEHIELLRKKYAVYTSDIQTLNDALQMMEDLGALLHVSSASLDIISQIQRKYHPFQGERKTALYLVWKNPIMAAGKNTFIDHMLQVAGFDNYYYHSSARYPSMNEIAVSNCDADYVFLSSEPFPFKKYIGQMEKLFPHSEVVYVDGEMFSWYGSRILKSFDYFEKLRAELPTV